MIYSIGHDIVDNRRFSHLLDRYEQKIIDRILSPVEKQVFAQKSHNKANYLAKRFAAKEAFAKACKTGLVDPILMPKISIINQASGQPVFQFNATIQKWLEQHQITNCHLSLSDESNYSSAFVVLEY